MTTINWELLNSHIESKSIATYQALSLASLFPHAGIPEGIAVDEYAFRYLKETVAAAWHGTGFNPQEITLDFHGAHLHQTTIDEEIILTQQQQAFYALHGFMQDGDDEIAKNVAKTWNYACMNGRDAITTTLRHPYGDYNYLNEDGSGNGTAVRPNPMYDANKSAAWTTTAIAMTDVSSLVAGMVAKGAKKKNLIIGYPKCATSLYIRKLAGSEDTTIEEYTRSLGVKDVIDIEDEYMWTQAGAVPAITAFDMWAFDPSEFRVLDGMAEKFQVVQGAGHDRNAYIQGEWWGLFMPVPLRKDESGTIKTYKHFGRVKAIANA